MDEKAQKNGVKDPGGRNIDPIQLVFWGFFLMIYGAYQIYATLKNQVEAGFPSFIIVYVIVFIFGSVVSYTGIKRERSSLKKK